MLSFSRVAASATTLAFFLSVSTSALAESTILSGMFDGAEPAIDALHNYGCAQEPLGYDQATFRVSSDGNYRLYNAFDHLDRHGAVAVHQRVYRGSFNPEAPEQNLKVWVGNDAYSFTAGETYVLVVQQLCENVEGAWAMAFMGPGNIISGNVAAVPNFTQGKFTASDPTKPWNPYSNEQTRYKQTGPIQVNRDGIYHFSGTHPYAQVELQIYSAPVNSADPWANLLASAMYGSETLELQAGRNYYFVTQWIGGDRDGEFLYVLAPPAPFRINPGLAGSWHNPDTPGQGFFLTAYEKINQVFLAWFTYDSQPPEGDEFAHRWMTAFGTFEGPSADLAIEWTAGGGFDAAVPAPEQNVDGNILLEFSDCSSGQITYSWGGDEFGSPTVSGVIPIQRLANDSVALCESLYAGPGMPGAL